MRKVVFAAVLVTATALVGCSSTAAGPTGPALSSADLASVNAVLQQYEAPPQYKASGSPIDASKLKGKRIDTIPVSSAIPFCNATDDELAKLTQAAGLQFSAYQNQGQLSQWVQGFNAAASDRADLINIFCGLDAEKVAPQVQQATDRGTPVVAAHTYAIGQPALPALKGVVYGAYVKAAQLMADGVIANTKGQANVLVLTSPSTSNSPFMEQAMKDEFAKRCPSCKVDYFGVNVPDWAKSIDPKVRAAISSNPNLNYVVPLYDGMVQFVNPAITATGAVGKVHVASFNATPGVLDQIREGDIVNFEVGEDPAWLAGAILDQDMRILLGQPLIENYEAGVRVFTKDNVKDAGVPAQLGQGYGTAAVPGYKKLWGVS